MTTVPVIHEFRLSVVARALGVEWRGDDVSFNSVSTDSRSLPDGALFVALRGEHFDGHDYLQQARQQGAVAAMVSQPVETDMPLLLVEDTRLALGQLAAGWRASFDIPVVAVTGSNGKTTVKEMIAAILRQQAEVLVTRGNLNNDIGVPLTLLGLNDNHEYGVIEMGANHMGEIGYLASLARPNVSLITNVGSAHLEGFGSLDAIAHAKGEIYAGLPLDGTAVINLDDSYADYWKTVIGGRFVISFGMQEDADVSVRDTEINETIVADTEGSRLVTTFALRTANEALPVSLSLAGRHNIMNALAAAAACLALGVTPGVIKRGLESMRPVAGRLQVREGDAGRHIIDDTYNANPSSVNVALAVLAACSGHRVLVLGDMAELGETAEDLHAQAGITAKAAGIESLYTLGKLSAAASRAFGDGAQHFQDHAVLIEALHSQLPEKATVLVKGSRFMHMETVVQALCKQREVM